MREASDPKATRYVTCRCGHVAMHHSTHVSGARCCVGGCPCQAFVSQLAEPSRKGRLSLLPWRGIPELVRVFESGLKGERKPHDYRKVPDRRAAYVDKALRHIAHHLGGELRDVESGETHLAHAAADLLIAIEPETP